MKTLERLKVDGLLSTEFSKFESRLWRQMQREGLKTVLMTSAVRGEGKSTSVAYLATSMGLYPGRRVLALDFDFRIPAMGSQFGLTPKVGLERVLEGDARFSDAVMSTELPGLDLALPSPAGADASLLLRTQVLRELFASVRETYDMILIDTPAIIPVADPTMLIPFADGVILAAMSGKTTEPQLRRAREICEGMDANLIGLVVSNVEEAAPDYISDGYGYGYHEPRPSPLPKSQPEQSPARSGHRAPMPTKSNGPRRRKPAGRQ